MFFGFVFDIAWFLFHLRGENAAVGRGASSGVAGRVTGGFLSFTGGGQVLITVTSGLRWDLELVHQTG